MLASGSIPSPPKEMIGTEEPRPGACFKWGKVSHWVGNCFPPQLLPGYCSDCGQAGHWRVHCPAWPRQSRLVPPFPAPQENLPDLLGLAADVFLGLLSPVTMEEPEVAALVASKSLAFLIDLKAVLFALCLLRWNLSFSDLMVFDD